MAILHKVVTIHTLEEIIKVEPPFIFIKSNPGLIKIHCDKTCEPGWYWDGDVYPPEYLKLLDVIPESTPLTPEQIQGFHSEIESLDDMSDNFRIIDSGDWIHGHKMDSRESIIQHIPTGAFLSLGQDREGDDWSGFRYSEISIKQVYKDYELKEVYKDSL